MRQTPGSLPRASLGGFSDSSSGLKKLHNETLKESSACDNFSPTGLPVSLSHKKSLHAPGKKCVGGRFYLRNHLGWEAGTAQVCHFWLCAHEPISCLGEVLTDESQWKSGFASLCGSQGSDCLSPSSSQGGWYHRLCQASAPTSLGKPRQKCWEPCSHLVARGPFHLAVTRA